MKRKVEWVSEARLAPYLRQTHGDEELAWELYEINAAVSAALSEVIHHVEVLLRNAMIHELERIHPLAYPWTLANTDSIAPVAAKLTDSSRKKAPNKDDVISQLNLGFWTQLVTSKDFRAVRLWEDHLRHAFPGQQDRKLVAQALEDLRELRNRCSHQDSLLHFHPAIEMTKIERLAGWIDPDAAEWIRRLSKVSGVMKNRPHVEHEPDTVILPSTRNRTMSDRGRFRYPLFDTYNQKSAIILEESVHIGQEIRHVGFYLPRYDPQLNSAQSTYVSGESRPHIPSVFPQIEAVVVPAEWSKEEAKRLKNGSEEDKRVAKAILHGLGNGYESGHRYVVYLLSKQDAAAGQTHRAPAEILHLGQGQTPPKWPFTKFLRLDLIDRARETTDLE